MNARRSQYPESVVRDIRRNTRRKYSTEEKIRISGDTAREATSSEVGGLRSENDQLKQLVAYAFGGGPEPPACP